MAKVVKYETIEQVVEATGVELTERTRPFLESFIKKATSENAGLKKKELMDNAATFGLTGLDEEKENVTTLQIKILTFLFEEGHHEEMKEFAAKHNLFVTDDGHIHRVKQAVKPIEERNAGVKAGTVGYNTIQVLKDATVASLTASEVATELEKRFNQKTTAPSVQWYINYCHKKVEEAVKSKNAYLATLEDGEADATKVAVFDAAIEQFTIAARSKANKVKTAEGGVALGAELTLEKAQAPKGFAKKAAAPAVASDTALGAELHLEGAPVEGEVEDGVEDGVEVDEMSEEELEKQTAP
jgi:hypothetical protein